MTSLRALIALGVVLGMGWWTFDQARSAASRSPDARRAIAWRGGAGLVVGVGILALGYVLYDRMNKESAAPIIPLFVGVMAGGGLMLFSAARLVGALVSRPE